MNTRQSITRVAALASLMVLAALLTSCATTPPPCNSPSTKNLSAAIDSVQTELLGGCEVHFDRYYDELLTIAEGDPKAENKRVFSEFLVWSKDQGLLSRRQAEQYYNRYFNVKFVALEGEYNNCSHSCPRRDLVYREMERELNAKQRGLVKVAMDSEGYYRANELYQEVELVLEATCTACAAR